MKFAIAPIRPLITIGVISAALLGTPASAAADQPAATYWHTRILSTTTHPWQFGSRSNRYSLVQQQIVESWTATDGKSWYGYRELGTRPKSAADKKAWQRDGAPTEWSKSIDGKTMKLSTEPSEGRVGLVPNRTDPTGRNRTPYELAGQRLTYDEVQRLPADPNGLKDWLTKAARTGRIPEGSIGSWVTGTLPHILYTLPAPKQVRSAAYRALLTMPGVRSAGNAKDTLGRSGTTVLIDTTTRQTNNVISSHTRLIVDTSTMVLLSQHQTMSANGKPSVKSSNETMVEVGWTDSQPTVPAQP
ncbi:hypothetical protein [Nonomuraea sp. NPDC005501]|uniref:hypothetical protein n=1 Tax=Nonomuraea sp. NPDC005501 TaxID=3156884 RepID=UPI0033BF0803